MSELTAASTNDRGESTERIVLPLSDAVRASLQAVRTAQETAQRRARRETFWARLWLGGIVATILVGVLALGRRESGRSPALQKAGQKTALGSVALAASSTAGGIAPAKGAAEVASSMKSAVAGGVYPATTPPSMSWSSPPVAVPAGSPVVDATTTACTATFGQRRWRMAIEMCTRAFEAQPKDAGIALRVAQAQHARGRLVAAGEWANRVIGLDPSLPEAFVIVAHAEAHGGHPGAAAEAYRRYLALAPHGWHAAEARGALRAHAREEHTRAHPRHPLSARSSARSLIALD